MKMIKKQDGVITVWLSLLLVLMLSFVGIVIEYVRVNMAKSCANMSSKLAIESVLCDYEPNVYKHYHILYVDTNAVNIESRLKEYANKSFDNDGLLKLSAKNIKVTNEGKISLNRDEYIKKQIAISKTKDSKAILSKSMLVDYVMNNFSSYADMEPNSELKKKRIYEVEYIIVGGVEDNDNILKITDSIPGFDAIKYPMSSYSGVLKSKLSSMSESTIISRMCTLMAENIYTTYGRNVDINNGVNRLEIKGEYTVNAMFAVTKKSNYTVFSSAKASY